MDIDLNPLDGDDSLGVNETLDDLGRAVESLVDFVVPEGIFDIGVPDEVMPPVAAATTPDAMAGVQAIVDGSMPPEVMNDGFYQSLPGVDSVVGVELDKTYELMDLIDEVGEDAVGAEAWEQAGQVAQIDPAGMLDDIETPAEMELRFTRDEMAGQRDFWDWQDSQSAQQVIDDSWALLNDPSRPV